MSDNFRNYNEEFYKKMDQGILAGMRCPKCGAKRYQYVHFCDKCGHAGLEEIELSPYGKLTIFAPTGDTMPCFAKYSTINGTKLSKLTGFSKEDRPQTSEYVWGEVVLDDGPSLFCFVKGFGIMTKKDLEPAARTLPRRVKINIEKAGGNSIPVAEIID